MTQFEVGRPYHRRRDIHDVFGGQRQSGIVTPSGEPVIFLFTGSSGHAHGYEDGFNEEDGTYLYFGQGQVGDMEMIRGNRAIRDHQKNGQTMHLFAERGGGYHSYMGVATYLDHYEQQAPDTNGELRRAFVFQLDLSDPSLARQGRVVREPPPKPRYSQMSLEELRRLAISTSGEELPPKERRNLVRYRSEAVREYVLRRAAGVCEGCGEDAPFRTKKNRPYLEAHHLRRRADGGPDDPHWVIGLCPTCHRRVHHGSDGDAYNEELTARMSVIESGGAES